MPERHVFEARVNQAKKERSERAVVTWQLLALFPQECTLLLCWNLSLSLAKINTCSMRKAFSINLVKQPQGYSLRKKQTMGGECELNAYDILSRAGAWGPPDEEIFLTHQSLSIPGTSPCFSLGQRG